MARVKLNRAGMERFRRRAKRAFLANKEYIELVGGRISPTGQITISEFFPIKHTANRSEIYYTPKQWDQVKAEVEASGLVFLGSVHTHPDGHDYPSACDNEGTRKTGEIITGILSVWKSPLGRVMTRTRWWWPQLPADVRYFDPAA